MRDVSIVENSRDTVDPLRLLHERYRRKVTRNSRHSRRTAKRTERIFISADRRDKEKRHRRRSRRGIVAPELTGGEGLSSTLNRHGSRAGWGASSCALVCVLPDTLGPSYCTYDEGSKFSGAISPKRRETVPRKDSQSTWGHRRPAREYPRRKISDFRKRGRKEITYVPIPAESGNDRPLHPPSLSSPVLVRGGDRPSRSAAVSLIETPVSRRNASHLFPRRTISASRRSHAGSYDTGVHVT
jgi:hypothetical protein